MVMADKILESKICKCFEMPLCVCVCVCVTLAYIPLAKAGHLVMPKSGQALQSHMTKGMGRQERGGGESGPVFQTSRQWFREVYF